MPRPSEAQVLRLDELLTEQIRTSSSATTYPAIRLRIPEYQRELSWDYEGKMYRLWTDMFRHLQTTTTPLIGNPFFLGNITVNYNSNRPQPYELVDGQQRITTLHVMAAAARDALIVTGHQDLALELQRNLLSTERGQYPRVSPLPNPNVTPALSPSLSSERMLEPYHKTMVSIETGCIVDGDQAAGVTTVSIRPGLDYLWDAFAADRVLKVRRGGTILSGELIWAMTADMEKGQSTPSTIPLLSSSSIDLEDGDELVLASEATWWHQNNLDEPNEYNLSNTMFSPHHRKLYVRVRGDVEHYIKQEKRFRFSRNRTTPANPGKYSVKPDEEAISTVLHFIGDRVDLVNSTGAIVDSFQLNAGRQIDFRDWDFDSSEWPDLAFFKSKPMTLTRVTTGHGIRIPFNSGITLAIPSESDRAEAIKDLLEGTTFIAVFFGGSGMGSGPGGAMQFFLDVNDPRKHTPLETYDLLNGFVHQLNAPSPTRSAAEQAAIMASWENIRKAIYLRQQKNPDVSSKFFYYFLMANRIWKSDGSRYPEAESYEGLIDHWESTPGYRTPTGDYDMAFLRAEFEVIERYAEIYGTISSPGTLLCPNPIGGAAISPTLAAKRMRKAYLYVLKNLEDVQWIPPYMALQYQLEDKSIVNTEEHLRDALKDYITLILKYGGLWRRLLPAADTTTGLAKCDECAALPGEHQSALYKSNELYGKITGDGNQIDLIHTTISGLASGATLSTDEIRDLINWLRTAPIFDGGTAPGLRDYYVVGDPHFSLIQRAISPGVLMAYESTVLGSDDPTWDHLEIEHILPKSPKNWGAPWYLTPPGSTRASIQNIHQRNVEKIGNLLLVESHINRHVSNMTLSQKQHDHNNCTNMKNPQSPCGCGTPPTPHDACGGGHYNNSAINSVTPQLTLTTWDATAIEARSITMMNAIVSTFNGW